MKKSNEISYESLSEMDLFSSKEEIVSFLLLSYLQELEVPLGSWVLKSRLDSENISVSTATVGRFLKNLDVKGFTKLIESQGRIITVAGRDYVRDVMNDIRRERLQKKLTKAAQPQTYDELLDLMSARKVLECETARLAALRANEKNISDLLNNVTLHETCLHKKSDSTEPALDFHRKVAEASNLRFLIASLDLLMNEELKLESDFLEITKEKANEYAQHHRLIAEAIQKGDVEEAEKQMGIHMDSMIDALKNIRKK